MAIRIAKIDYDNKAVTFENCLDDPTAPVSFSSPDDTMKITRLRQGLTIEGDGVDKNGMFINPRRVR